MSLKPLKEGLSNLTKNVRALLTIKVLVGQSGGSGFDIDGQTRSLDTSLDILYIVCTSSGSKILVASLKVGIFCQNGFFLQIPPVVMFLTKIY